MSDKVLRLEEANTLYKDLRKRISDSNQKLSTKLDDAEVADGYLILKAEGQPVVKLTGFGGSGGGGGGGGTINNAKLTFTKEFTWNTKTFSDSSDVIIPYSWSSIEGGTETGPGTLVVVVNNSEKARIAGVTQDGGRIKTINIKPYLVNGPNTVRLTMIDIYENQSTISFTVNIVSYKISSPNFIDNTVIKGDTTLFQYIPVGSGLKTIYFDIDGITVGTVTTRNSGTTEEYYIPTSGLSFGSHRLEVYFTVQLDAEDPESIVYSNTLAYSIIYQGDSNEVTISSSHPASFTVNQYETISIPYVVYNPLSEKSTVEYYVDGELLSTINVSNLVEETWIYVVREGNPDGSTNQFTKRFEIRVGTVSKIFTATIIPSEIMIEPVTSALALYLTAQNRSNSEPEETRAKWEFTPSFSTDTISCNMQGFNWLSNGWMTDSDGNPILRVSNGAKVDIPYEIFGQARNDEVDTQRVGRTIEVEFATSNVNDYDTILFKCYEDSTSRGIIISAQKATLTVGSELETQYKENEHVRLSFVITPTAKETDEKLQYCYINGIMSSVVPYSSFDEQLKPQPISIGSEDATIDIYNIRVYETALTRDQVVNNWIADMSNYEEKLAYYEENNIFEEGGGISYNKLPQYLPYMILNVYDARDKDFPDVVLGNLPPDKGKKRLVSGSFTDPLHPEANFTFVNAETDVQGTSSREYPVKNYKFKFKENGFIPVNEKTASIRFTKKGSIYNKFRVRDNAVAESTFTFKADYASSEGANNVELIRFYNDNCTYKTPPQQDDAKELAAGNSPYLRRQGIDGFPMVIFGIYEEGGTPTFIGKYNFNNDKGTEDTYGFEANGMEFKKDKDTKVITISHDGIPDESWEMGDNNSNYNRFTDYPTGSNAEVANALLVTSSGTGDSMFEVRYPSEWQDASEKLGSGTQMQIARTSRFKNLMQWVSSTDTYEYNPSTHPRGIKYQYILLSDYKPDPIVLKSGDDVSKYYVKSGDTFISTVTKDNPNPKYDSSQTYYIKEAELLPNPVSYSESYIPVSNVIVGETVVTSYYEKDANGLYVQSLGAPVKDGSGNITYNGLAEEGVVYYEYAAVKYYYDNEEYRKAKFSNEFQKYFNLTDTVFYYIYTELFLMIDSRVKNSFPTYFADVYSKNVTTVEKTITKDETAQSGVEYFYKDTVYNLKTDITVSGSSVYGLYKVDTDSSTDDNIVYVACSEEELAQNGIIYYDMEIIDDSEVYTVTKTLVTYPSDVSEYYILVDGQYIKAENPPQPETSYYEATESGDFIKDENLKEGDPLTGHIYYVNTEVTDTLYYENLDDTGWPLGRWCWLPYDMDTALGINNRGKLAFSYNLEDTDTINADGDPVFNGQDSVMWTNIRKCFYTNIKNTYEALRADTVNGNFSYNNIEGRFTKHQRTWPAKVWNEDAYNKYIYPYLSTRSDSRPQDYLAMCLGDKSQQRKWWMYNRFRYLDSKYSCGDSGDESRIKFRAYNRGTGIIKIKPYSDIYLRFRCGKAIDEQVRGVRNEFTTFRLKEFNPKETETYIFSGDQIIDLRGLNELAVDNLDISVASKLQYLYIDGYHHIVEYVDGQTTYLPSYENSQFDKLDLFNCSALKELSAKDNSNFSTDPRLQNCKDLKYVNLLGTKLTAVTFPDGGVLERVYLPNTMTSVILKNQQNIKEFHIMKKATDEEYENASELDRYNDLLDADDKAYCKYVEDISALTKVVFINVNNAIQDKMLEILYKLPEGSRVRYDGFDFKMDTSEEINTFISTLDTMRWADKDGNNTSEVGIIGSLNSDVLTLSYEDVANWKSKYKDLNFKYNIRKTVKFYDLDVEATSYDSVYYETQYTTFNMENGSVTVPEVTNSLSRPHRDDVMPSYDSESKTWTNGTHYTFVGWNTRPGQTTVEFGFHDDLSWSEIDVIPAEDYEVGPMNTSLVLYPAFRETPIYSVNFYNFNGTSLLGTETRIDSGDIETEIIQTPVMINGTQVEVLGWGNEPYGSYDPNILLDVSDSFNVYSILDWPITSLRIAESKTDQLYYNGERFDTSSVVVEAEKKLIDETNSTISKYLVVSDKEYSYAPNGNLTYDDRKITFSLKGSTVDLPIGIAYSMTQSVNESGQPIDPTDAVLDMIDGISEPVNLEGLSLDISFKYGESDETRVQKLVIDSQTSNKITWSPKTFTTSGSHNVDIVLKKDTSLTTSIVVYVVPEVKTLDKASWSDIQAATYAGYAPNWWSIGDEKLVVLDNKGDIFTHKYFTVRILGFDHNTDIETSGKHTVTFGFANTWTDDGDAEHTVDDPEYVESGDGEMVKSKFDFGVTCNVMFDPDSRTIDPRYVSVSELKSTLFPTWADSRVNETPENSFRCIGRDFCMDVYNLMPEDMKSVMMPTKKYQLDMISDSKERLSYYDLWLLSDGMSGSAYDYPCNVSESICGQKDDNGNYITSPMFFPSIYELFGPSDGKNENRDKESEYCKQFEYYSSYVGDGFTYDNYVWWPRQMKMSATGFNPNTLEQYSSMYTRSSNKITYYKGTNINIWRIYACFVRSLHSYIKKNGGGRIPPELTKQSNISTYSTNEPAAIVTPMFVVG